MQTINKLIAGFVLLIIGTVFIAQIASSSLEKTTTTRVTNETVSIAAARNASGQLNTSKVFYPTYYATGWKATDGGDTCLPGKTGNGFVLLNASGATMTDATNYDVADDGSFTLLSVAPLNGTTTSNTTYVSYSYCGNEYMNLSWGRTMMNLVSGFFAIAILMVAVGLFYSVGKDTGIIQ